MKFILFTIILSTNAFSLSDDQAVLNCLKNFKSHPFSSTSPKYRTLKPTVKVLGFGSDLVDSVKSKEADLVLIKNTVSVISKRTYNLLSPNSWYCLGGNVSVISDLTIKINCSARFTSARDGVVVIGKEDSKASGGVTIIGKTKFEYVDCPKK